MNNNNNCQIVENNIVESEVSTTEIIVNESNKINDTE